MLGEYPDLPPTLIAQLRQRAMLPAYALANWAWDYLADGAVTVFEGHQRNSGIPNHPAKVIE